MSGVRFYEIRKGLRDAGKTPIIPRRGGAICPGVRDKERYKTRSNIERFFGKIKENKRMALRFDKLDFLLFLCSRLSESPKSILLTVPYHLWCLGKTNRFSV